MVIASYVFALYYAIGWPILRGGPKKLPTCQSLAYCPARTGKVKLCRAKPIKSSRDTMKTRLVSYSGGKIDLAFPIQDPRVTIGREADNLIQLPHEKISKHHAVIHPAGEAWVIEDLHSTNGVFVNGKRVERQQLKDGDRVKLGPYEFYFETNVPSDDWVPSHIIDMSSEIHKQTIRKPEPPEK